VSDDPQETGVGPAPPETVALWVKRVATMRADEVDEFEPTHVHGVGPEIVRRLVARDRPAGENTGFIALSVSRGGVT
jgi:hypothetical protein